MAAGRSSSATWRRERICLGSFPFRWISFSSLASRTAVAFSWTSQPIEFLSGSSPAVVSTIQTGCRLLDPAPNVITSHKSRFGCAWSSSKITQLGLYPCLLYASADKTCKIPIVVQYQLPSARISLRRYSILRLLSTFFSSPVCSILIVQSACSSI